MDSTDVEIRQVPESSDGEMEELIFTQSGAQEEQAKPGPQEAKLRFRGDSVYLKHGEIKFVRVDDKNFYFSLGALGMDPFRFYKGQAQDFLRKLNSGMQEGLNLVSVMSDQAVTSTSDSEDYKDGVVYDGILTDNVDPLTNLRFRLRVVTSIFEGKPYLHVRSFVYAADRGEWQTTRRGVRIALEQTEEDLIKDFITEKCMVAAAASKSAIQATHTLA